MTALVPPGQVLLDEAAIRQEVARLAARMSADYAGRQPHLVGVLKGAALFVADLLRALTVPATLDFISTIPYGTLTPSGVVRIRKDLDEPIEGRDVILVQAVCAGGLSLAYLLRNFETRHPASLRVCVLLAKQRPRPPEARLDYVGREIPDVFVVGYGLDRDERYRNLPCVIALAGRDGPSPGS